MLLASEIGMKKESKLAEIHDLEHASPKSPRFLPQFFSRVGAHFSLSALVLLDGQAKCLVKRR